MFAVLRQVAAKLWGSVAECDVEASNRRRDDVSVSAKSSPRNQHYRAYRDEARPKILFELSA
jgi:hypothetical protein